MAGVRGQVSITWQHKSAAAQPFTNVISLSQDGVVEKQGKFASRGVRAARTAPDSFVLELDEVTPSDSGVYQCSVSEWQTNSKTFSQSAATTVNVAPIRKIHACLPLSKDIHFAQADGAETHPADKSILDKLS